MGGILGLRTEVEFERDAGIEMDAVEHPGDDRFSGVDAVATGSDGAREHQRQSGRAVLQILQRLRVRRNRIGMVDALQDLPWRGRRTAGQRPRLRGALIEPVDAQAVAGLADELLLVGGTLEHDRDQTQPVFAACGGETPRPAEGGRRNDRPLHMVIEQAAAALQRDRTASPGRCRLPSSAGCGCQALDSARIQPLQRVGDAPAADRQTGADFHSGTSTKARSNKRGCGNVSPGSFTTRSS